MGCPGDGPAVGLRVARSTASGFTRPVSGMPQRVYREVHGEGWTTTSGEPVHDAHGA